MQRFLSFLTEAATGQTSAHQGVAFEIATMHALNNDKHPESFRNEAGKSPEEVHKSMIKHLGSKEFENVQQEGRKAATALKNHLAETHPDYKIHNVTWTSNPSDVQRYHDREKTGGKQTSDDNADYVVALKHKRTGVVTHVSVSSKRGSESAKTPGHNTLSQLSHSSEQAARAIDQEHGNRLNKLLDKHINSYSKMSGEAKANAFREFSKKNKNVAEQARSIARERGVASATHYHEQFSKIQKNPEKIKEAIRSLSGSGSKSFTTHLKVASKNGKVSIVAPDEKVNNTLNNIKSFHVSHEGNKVTFHGTDPQGNTHKLANVEFRSKSLNSSPHIPYIGSKSFIK